MFFTSSRAELWTGIECVDRERRKLFAMLDELSDKFDSFASARAVSRDFAALQLQISTEFAAEERLMRAKRYALYGAHKSEHERLLEQFSQMIEAYEEGACMLCGTNLRSCLETWLGDHVRNEDRALKTLVN